MKRLLTVTMLVFAFSTSAFAEPLSDREITKQNWIRGLSAADAITTIVGVGKGLVESNAILGVAPEPVAVVTYFVARQVLIEYITPKIEKQWRSTWQNTWIGVNGLVVISNLALILK